MRHSKICQQRNVEKNIPLDRTNHSTIVPQSKTNEREYQKNMVNHTAKHSPIDVLYPASLDHCYEK